ncbi:phytanoyl-CoA dioxygenase family protein [Thermobifida alba]|uniref:Phytanoyl-CoA dioxygenase family protein n=1 Tax=Thermobifida alba TaxID=53522 RepID=A0ABY4L1K2_THEAE|nr:phytanoyl-CoA dioxygenase family protein [Thermobifida alba]UPT20811.1 phytanoyl-CoA dioxygenase family protein [Thermobifida alba]
MTAQTADSPAESVGDDFVRNYREQGFAHVPGVLTSEEVARYRAAADRLYAAESPVVWGTSEEEVQVHYVEHAWQKEPLLRELALHPRITAIALRLAGCALRLYSSDLLVKEPRTALPTLVHDDEPGLPLANLDNALTAWIALGDVPAERGCLSFVPGSHRRPESDRQTRMESFADYRPMPNVWPDFPWRPRVTVPLRAGDVTFHHFRTVHMAGDNHSDERRVGNGVIYIDDGATYRPGVQDEHLRGMAPGQRLDGEDFPRIGHT